MDPTHKPYSEKAWLKDGFHEIKKYGSFLTKTVIIVSAHPELLYKIFWIRKKNWFCKLKENKHSNFIIF